MGGRVRPGPGRPEHVGAPRAWSDDETRFAASVADIVALAMEQVAYIEACRAFDAQSRRLEEERRMASLGRVAAAVAHDFNKLLQVVLTRVENIVAVSGPAVAEDARALADAIARSGDLTAQLAELGRRPSASSSPVVIDRVVDAASEVLRGIPRHGQRVEIELGAREAVVRIEPLHLDQVLVNLVANALGRHGRRGHGPVVDDDARER